MDITRLLIEWQSGNPNAFGQLIPLVYKELRKLSASILRSFLQGQGRFASVSPTDLVHMAFPKLQDHKHDEGWHWKSRSQFYGLVKKVMLWTLLDYEKDGKRHSPKADIEIQDQVMETGVRLPSAEDIVALDQAMALLAKVDRRTHQIIRMRFFEERPVSEIASLCELKKSMVYQEITAGLGLLKHHLDVG